MKSWLAKAPPPTSRSQNGLFAPQYKGCGLPRQLCEHWIETVFQTVQVLRLPLAIRQTDAATRSDDNMVDHLNTDQIASSL